MVQVVSSLSVKAMVLFPKGNFSLELYRNAKSRPHDRNAVISDEENWNELGKPQKLDAGWPESEEEQVGNVKLEEEVTRRSKD